MKRIFSILFALVLAVSLMLVPATPALATSHPLVGLWHFDEGEGTTAFDSSGNGNTGTLMGDTSWATSDNAMFGDALMFNGTSNYVDFGDPDSLEFGSSNYAIEAWFNAATDMIDPGMIVTKMDGWGGNSDWQIFIIPGEGEPDLLYYQARHYYQLELIVSGDWSDGEWHHVVVTKTDTGDSGTKLYVDGDFKVSGRGVDIEPGTQHVMVGRNAMAEAFYFKGIIDEVRIWDEALSSDEIDESFWLGEARNNDDYDTIVSHEAGSSVFIFTSAFHDVDDSDNISFRLMRVDSTATINATAGTNGISTRGVTPNPKKSDWPLSSVLSGDPADTERDIFPGTPTGPGSHRTLHLDVNLTGGLEPLGFNLHTKGL